MRTGVKTEAGFPLGFVLPLFLDYIRERPIGRMLSGLVKDFLT
jgi:hypothetical protein